MPTAAGYLKGCTQTALSSHSPNGRDGYEHGSSILYLSSLDLDMTSPGKAFLNPQTLLGSLYIISQDTVKSDSCS